MKHSPPLLELSFAGNPAAKYFGGFSLEFPSCSETLGVMMAESGGGSPGVDPLRGSFISRRAFCSSSVEDEGCNRNDMRISIIAVSF